MSETVTRPNPPAPGRRAFLGTAIAGIGVLASAGAYFLATPSGGPSPASAQAKSDASEFPMADLMKTGTIEERTLGPVGAPVTIIEYASATCGHCAHFHNTTWPKLKEKYIDTGKVHFIFRDFPLDNYAAAAAMLAHCVPVDKYFAFVEALFSQQKSWAYVEPAKRVDTLFNFSKQAGFTKAKFEACLKDQKLLDGINWVRARANREFGVNSTPTFFINGKVLRGSNDLSAFEEIMAPYLNS